MKLLAVAAFFLLAAGLYAQQPITAAVSTSCVEIPAFALSDGPTGLIACSSHSGTPFETGVITEPAPIAPDSTPVPPKRKLQPENLSIMERAMWGEGGFMRGIGFTGPLTPVSRKNELTARRTMLSTHQIGGFVTMACMLGAVYCGQKTLDGDVTYQKYHQQFVTATIVSYSLTGLLAILSPPPSIRRDEVSTTSVHKTLAWAHVIGMILTPIMGGQINRRQGYGAAAHFHQVAAYVTTTIFAASLLTMTL